MKKGNAKHYQLKSATNPDGITTPAGYDAAKLKKKGIVSPKGELFPVGPRTSILIEVPEGLTGDARLKFIKNKIEIVRLSMRKVV